MIRRTKLLLVVVGALLFAPASRAAITSLDDVKFWTGSGAKRAAVVIDWNGESSADASLAWGYRWDGDATGEDMLRAVIAADDRLYAKLGQESFLGMAVRGLGYDANNDGEFAVESGATFDSDGVADSGPADLDESSDPGDLYAEGWFISGTWNYALGAGVAWPGGTWTHSHEGATSRDLVDGSWDSWAFTASFRMNAFAANATAAPLPLASADFDADFDVDGADLLLWQRGLGITTGAGRLVGDATGDGAVTAADLVIWKTEFSGGAAVVATSSAPEPTVFASLSTCASAIFVARRKTVRQLTRPRRSAS